MILASLPIVSCDNCGACCMSMMFPPFEDEDDEMVIPEELEIELDAAWKESISGKPGASRLGMPCFWFDEATRRCKHYEFRPGICRRFEPGSRICLIDRNRHGVGITAEQRELIR